MAQSRMLSVFAKQEKMENDIGDMVKTVASLKESMRMLRKNHRGRKALNKLETEDIQTLLQISLTIDNLILKIQNQLNRCNSHNFFIQRQLELQNHRK